MGRDFETCEDCGRRPADAERLVGGRCLRCRALGLLEGCSDAVAGHTRRVTMLALLVADEMRATVQCRFEVELGGLLHDIGKLSIPAEIIHKAGPLDEAEAAVMRTHVEEGERRACELEALPASVPSVVRASHERWDGDGYPDGLRGEAIPLASRVVSAADAFDAMTSSRSYRAALPIDFAVDVLRHEAGRQFDPEVVGALVRTIERWREELMAEPIASAFDTVLRRLRREGPTGRFTPSRGAPADAPHVAPQP